MILMNARISVHRYRNLVNGENVQPPIIPFYPVVKKDLTFIHLANDTTVEGLVNFEKLRMIAKEVSQSFISRYYFVGPNLLGCRNTILMEPVIFVTNHPDYQK